MKFSGYYGGYVTYIMKICFMKIKSYLNLLTLESKPFGSERFEFSSFKFSYQNPNVSLPNLFLELTTRGC